jgi:hypothetical protein
LKVAPAKEEQIQQTQQTIKLTLDSSHSFMAEDNIKKVKNDIISLEKIDDNNGKNVIIGIKKIYENAYKFVQGKAYNNERYIATSDVVKPEIKIAVYEKRRETGNEIFKTSNYPIWQRGISTSCQKPVSNPNINKYISDLCTFLFKELDEVGTRLQSSADEVDKKISAYYLHNKYEKKKKSTAAGDHGEEDDEKKETRHNFSETEESRNKSFIEHIKEKNERSKLAGQERSRLTKIRLVKAGILGRERKEFDDYDGKAPEEKPKDKKIKELEEKIEKLKAKIASEQALVADETKAAADEAASEFEIALKTNVAKEIAVINEKKEMELNDSEKKPSENSEKKSLNDDEKKISVLEAELKELKEKGNQKFSEEYEAKLEELKKGPKPGFLKAAFIMIKSFFSNVFHKNDDDEDMEEDEAEKSPVQTAIEKSDIDEDSVMFLNPAFLESFGNYISSQKKKKSGDKKLDEKKWQGLTAVLERFPELKTIAKEFERVATQVKDLTFEDIKMSDEENELKNKILEKMLFKKIVSFLQLFEEMLLHAHMVIENFESVLGSDSEDNFIESEDAENEDEINVDFKMFLLFLLKKVLDIREPMEETINEINEKFEDYLERNYATEEEDKNREGEEYTGSDSLKKDESVKLEYRTQIALELCHMQYAAILTSELKQEDEPSFKTLGPITEETRSDLVKFYEYLSKMENEKQEHTKQFVQFKKEFEEAKQQVDAEKAKAEEEAKAAAEAKAKNEAQPTPAPKAAAPPAAEAQKQEPTSEKTAEPEVKKETESSKKMYEFQTKVRNSEQKINDNTERQAAFLKKHYDEDYKKLRESIDKRIEGIKKELERREKTLKKFEEPKQIHGKIIVIPTEETAKKLVEGGHEKEEVAKDGPQTSTEAKSYKNVIEYYKQQCDMVSSHANAEIKDLRTYKPYRPTMTSPLRVFDKEDVQTKELETFKQKLSAEGTKCKLLSIPENSQGQEVIKKVELVLEQPT